MIRWIYLFISVLSVWLLLTFLSNASLDTEGATAVNTTVKLPKSERIEGMIELEFMKTVDPATGNIPRDRLLKVRDQIKDMKRLKINPFNIDWEERGPNMVGGRTRGMIFDLNDPTGNTVWAGGVTGGLWKNTNIRSATSSWIKVGDDFANIGITSIVQNPINPNVMFFGTGEEYTNARGMGIWRSVDGGDTWEPSEGAEDLNLEFVFYMVSDSDGNIYAGTEKGLFATDDDGITWRYLLGENRSAESNDINDVEIASNGTIFATSGVDDGDGIYRRLAGQNSFTKLGIDVEQSNYRRIEIAVAPSDPNRIYALLAGNGGACSYILRSDNGGSSWTEMTVPRAVGMNNFARNQAWYDLEVGVDPNNPDRLYIGGIDILLSEDGGENWQQVSQWFGRNFQYVHADQHRVVFSPFNPNEAIFGNDGGVFYCPDITSSDPVIESRILDYNVTQYYAAALHPTDDNLFIGGTQDNGSHIFESAGMNPGRRLTGGDGAFCHIDKDDPEVMITSYVYSTYYFSNNGGNDFVTANFGNNNGLFINPTEYDSETNTLYANFTGGRYLKVNNVHLLNRNEDVIPVPEFDGASIQSLKASPNVFDRVYFGLTNGRIVYLDEASIDRDTAHAVEISPRLVQGSFLSSIDVAEGNEDHIIATFSNYGVESVWETKDGGDNWENIEGNLPDMPVRWAMFAPDNDGLILLATEMGVWSSADINGSDTEWTPSNLSFANTRVDMLTKNSNGTVLAATHGRGMFTTNSFKDVSVSLLDSFAVHFNSRYREEGCETTYDTIRVPLVISRVPDNDIDVEIDGTDSWPENIRLVSDVIRFSSSNSETKQDIEILVAQDDFLGDNQSIDFSLKPSADYEFGDISAFSAEIIENLSLSIPGLMYRVDSVQTKISLIDDKIYGNRAQIIYSIEELNKMGMQAGEIYGIQLYALNSDNSMIGANMEMYIGKASFDNSPFGFPYQSGLGDAVFEGNYAFQKGTNTFIFDQPYVWDGNSHMAIQFCFTDVEAVGDISLVSNRMDRNTMINRISDDDRIDPCSFFTATDYHEIQPIIGFIGQIGIADSSILETVWDSEDGVAIVFNKDYKLMASVRGRAAVEACVETEIQLYDNAIVYPVIEGPYSKKEFYINSDESADREMSFWFSSTDLSDLDTSELEIIICSEEFESAALDQCQIIDGRINITQTGLDSFFTVNTTIPGGEWYLTIAKGLITNSNEEIQEEGTQIYPIPFNDKIYVDSDGDFSVKVMDVNGRILMEDLNNVNSTILNTSALIPGVYWIVVECDTGKTARKILK